MKSLLQALQQALPKPALFGLYGALGGLLGALFLGELLWFLLSPATAKGEEAPPLQLAASEAVSLFQGGKNRLTVKIARSRFDGPVTVRLLDLPTGLTAPPVVIPADKTEAEVEVNAAVDAETTKKEVKIEARGDGDGPKAEGKTELSVLVVPPSLRIAVSPEMEILQGGKNRFRVKIARDRFKGPVEIEPKSKAALPEGLTFPTVTIPEDQTEIEIEVSAGRSTTPGQTKIALMGYGPTRETLKDEDTLTLKVKPYTIPEVDVMFVLDVTGSMGNAINGVRDGINDFVAKMGEKLDSRVGLIAYRDHKSERDEPEILKFGGALFTKDTAAFKAEVSKLRAARGGDEPESTLDAITLAAAQQFRPRAHKVLLVITDASPHIPDKDTKSIEEAVVVLNKYKIDQLHFAVHNDFFRSHWNRFYKQFSQRPPGQMGKAVPGKFFDLAGVMKPGGGAVFAKELLPSLSTAITEAVMAGRPTDLQPADMPASPRTKAVGNIEAGAAPPSIKSVQSTAGYAEGSELRLVLATAVWTGVIAAGVCLALIAAQYFYLRQALVRVLEAGKGIGGGLLAGLVGGALGQLLFQLAPNSSVAEALFRVLGWTILGSLAGLGLAFFVPNLRPDKGLLGGAVGGAVGALGFLVVALIVHDMIARLLGALLLGGCIGVMVALAERAFRTAWLEVRYGREVRTVNLGPEPVSIGSSSKDCTIYARNAAPIAFRYWARNGKITRQDALTEQLVEMRPGESHPVGGLVVAVCAAGADEVLPVAVQPVAVAQPAQPVNRPVRLSPSIGKPGSVPPPTSPPQPARPPVAGPASALPAERAPRLPVSQQPTIPPTTFGQPTVASPRAPAGPPPVPPPGPPRAASPPTAPAQAANACPHCGFKAPPGEPGKRFCMVCEKRF